MLTRRGSLSERRDFALALRGAALSPVFGAQTPQRRMDLKDDPGARARVARRFAFRGREYGGSNITTQFVGD